MLCTLIEHALQTNDSGSYIWILSWITRVYLIQTALCARKRKKKKKKRTKLPCMKNYFHFDFMFFPHEFLLNRATLTYLNLVLKLHQLMQSSLRSPWKVNDGRKRSRRRQCHCFWNPKIRGKTSKKFCKVFKLTNWVKTVQNFIQQISYKLTRRENRVIKNLKQRFKTSFLLRQIWDVLGDSRKRYRGPWAEIGKYWPGKEPIRLQDSLPCPLKKIDK